MTKIKNIKGEFFMQINFSQLEELSRTKEPLNYKKLCERIGMDYHKSGGEAKIKQLEDLASVCEFHVDKKPTRYIIDKFPIESQINKKYHSFKIIEQINAFDYKVICDCGKEFIASLRDIKKNKRGLCTCQFKSKNTFILSSDKNYYTGIDSNDNTFLFSARDFERVSRHTWQVWPDGYVGGRVCGKNISLHRFIMEEELKENPKLEVDHIFHIRNDNRREKLRVVTKAENLRNRRIPKNRKSPERPISKCTLYKITDYPELGYFETKVEAQEKLNEIMQEGK